MKLGDEIADKLMDYIPKGIDPDKAAVPQVSVFYRKAFNNISNRLRDRQELFDNPFLTNLNPSKNNAKILADGIFDVAKKYGYPGAWDGELNYSTTILIQDVPLAMVEKGAWAKDLRYWLYAGTVGALNRTVQKLDKEMKDDWITDHLCGVFIDIKDEYKRRMNPAYETEQILKSGDCYGGSYATKLVNISGRDIKGNSINAWVDATLANEDGSVKKQSILLPRQKLWLERAETK
jgi:hypothetical protein